MNTKKVLTVLIVDDDRDFLLQHEIMLKSAGYRVITAQSRKEAEDAASQIKPDLAVLDLMMDEMDDGFVLANFLKKKFDGIPVIIVSAVTSETGIEFDDSEGGSSWTGADAIIQKPIRFEQLGREIERLCR